MLGQGTPFLCILVVVPYSLHSVCCVLFLQDDGDSYSWTDGWPVFFTHWGPGEPSNHKGEGCVSMHGSVHFHGTWNDTACDSARPYICKISSGTNQWEASPIT